MVRGRTPVFVTSVPVSAPPDLEHSQRRSISGGLLTMAGVNGGTLAAGGRSPGRGFGRPVRSGCCER